MKWRQGILIATISLVFLTSGLLVANASSTEARSSQTTSAEKTQKEKTEWLAELNKTLGKEPVDARVDRVWHAIPGLCGWSLDIARSLEESAKDKSGVLHLVWNPVPPKTRLKVLPPEPIYRGPATEKSAALMFNVAWGESDIPSILNTLDKYHVKATFFLDGDWVQKNHEIARRLAADGQAIGSHGTGHPDFRRLSNGALVRQVTATNERILHTIGKKVDLLAPPAGAYDSRIVRLARQHNMYTVLWTVDTIDWKRPPANVIVKRVMAQIEPGSLILMHPTPSTAAALPVVIERLQEKGYQLKTVEAVVREEPVAHPPETLRQKS